MSTRRAHAETVTEARPVRRRTVAHADGRLEVVPLVPCPESGGASPLEECATCARCLALPVDASRPDAEVVCRRTAPVPPRPAPVVRRVPADVVELALRTPVGAVVGTDVFAVRADASVATARALEARGEDALVVVDEAARPTGLLTQATLRRADLDPETAVAEVAIPFPGELRDDTALVHALAGLVEGPEGRALPVVDDTGALLAVLSPVDVVRWLARRAGYAV